MKVSEHIDSRQPQWHELERLSAEIKTRKLDADSLANFSALYRAACADLALAEAYQFPPKTVDYLHRLVAVAHNQLYRSQKFEWGLWYRRIFEETPQRVFNDGCVHFSFLLFWSLFLLSAFLAYENDYWPDFAVAVIGEKQLEFMTESFTGFDERTWNENMTMTGFYIRHNASIGLQCFVLMLFLLPGLVVLSFNAVYLGAAFGYMFRPELADTGVNFQNFVTAHGPFELTAIILSAGAGLRIGMSWLSTGGHSRLESLENAARESLPTILCAVALFCLAALIEGFVSPAPARFVPWWVKGLVASLSSFILMVYFVILGYPRPQRKLKS
jgi:uncharacterized membrane protein SpoIIM required for sporulation